MPSNMSQTNVVYFMTSERFHHWSMTSQLRAMMALAFANLSVWQTSRYENALNGNVNFTITCRNNKLNDLGLATIESVVA